MAQSGANNVHHQLESILNNQHLIVQNQNNMMDKLNDIEKRLINVETCIILQQHQVAMAFVEQQQNQQHQQFETTYSSSSGRTKSSSTSSLGSTTQQQQQRSPSSTPKQPPPVPPTTPIVTTSFPLPPATTTTTTSNGHKPHKNNSNNHHQHTNYQNHNKHALKKFKSNTIFNRHSTNNANTTSLSHANSKANGTGGTGGGKTFSRLFSTTRNTNLVKKPFLHKTSQSSKSTPPQLLAAQTFQLDPQQQLYLLQQQQQQLKIIEKKPQSSATLTANQGGQVQKKQKQANSVPGGKGLSPSATITTASSLESPDLPSPHIQSDNLSSQIKMEVGEEAATTSQSSNKDNADDEKNSQLLLHKKSDSAQINSTTTTTATTVELSSQTASSQVDHLKLHQTNESGESEIDSEGDEDEEDEEEELDPADMSYLIQQQHQRRQQLMKNNDPDNDDESKSTQSADSLSNSNMTSSYQTTINSSSTSKAASLPHGVLDPAGLFNTMKLQQSGLLNSLQQTFNQQHHKQQASIYPPGGSSGSSGPITSIGSTATMASNFSSAEYLAMATDTTTGQVLLSENEIVRTFAISKSRGNFAALLVQQLYNKHERITSNVMGTRGKQQLSQRRMTVVKRITFRMYPASGDQEEETIWKKECVKAIDSKNRKIRPMASNSGTISNLSSSGSSSGATAGNNASSQHHHHSGLGASPSRQQQHQSSQHHPSLFNPQAFSQSLSQSNIMGGRTGHGLSLAVNALLNRPMLPNRQQMMLPHHMQQLSSPSQFSSPTQLQHQQQLTPQQSYFNMSAITSQLTRAEMGGAGGGTGPAAVAAIAAAMAAANAVACQHQPPIRSPNELQHQIAQIQSPPAPRFYHKVTTSPISPPTMAPVSQQTTTLKSPPTSQPLVTLTSTTDALTVTTDDDNTTLEKGEVPASSGLMQSPGSTIDSNESDQSHGTPSSDVEEPTNT